MIEPTKCTCGSGQEREQLKDARGIFVAFVCDKCITEKQKGYRPEIFTDPDYWADEQIEPED
tara:strand:- start:10635 stop:10820 length:186 start_codon:yes stop_codon:yes gene_type:complete